jgi:hypothetical protein
MMFAEVAHQLLRAVGKETTARGVFTVDEMPPAAAALRQAVERSHAPAQEDEEAKEAKEKPVALGQRAWPFIDMLERSARGGKDANIVWEAPRDF